MITLLLVLFFALVLYIHLGVKLIRRNISSRRETFHLINSTVQTLFQVLDLRSIMITILLE